MREALRTDPRTCILETDFKIVPYLIGLDVEGSISMVNARSLEMAITRW
jgi:hypothetical protein